MPERNRVMVFGDSILKGVVLEEGQGYRVSDALQLDKLGAAFGLTVENRSRFGCTTGKGMAMLDRCLERGDRPAAVVLGYGGNDADFDWAAVAAAPEAEHQSHTPLQQFAALYRAAIDKLTALQIKPVLITLPPVCAERYFHWITRAGLSAERILSWLGDVGAIYRYQERYSRTLESIARETGCPCIDLRGAMLQNRCLDGLYCLDGIHPNEAGQRILRETFAANLQQQTLRFAD